MKTNLYSIKSAFFATVLCLSSFSGLSSQTLEAQYNFDGDINDATTNGRNLAVVGSFTPTYVADHNSVASTALAAPFTAANYLTATNYNGVATGARTLMCWYKSTSTTTATQALISTGQNVSGTGFALCVYQSTVAVGACLKAFGGQSNVGTNYTLNLNDGNWHHLAISYDPADGTTLDKTKLYIDGTLKTVNVANSYQPTTVLATTSSHPVRIGVNYSRPTAGDVFTNGAIDDVRIYSGAVSASTIASIAGVVTSAATMEQNNVKVYPTHINEYFTVKSPVSAKMNITIFNALGAVVKSVQTVGECTVVNTSDLTNGIYCVSIVCNGKTELVKVIK